MDTQSTPLAIWETGKDESTKPAVKEAARRGADALILLGNETSSRGLLPLAPQTGILTRSSAEVFTATISTATPIQPVTLLAQVLAQTSGVLTRALSLSSSLNRNSG
jgi:hypothetical protein